ncbi:hypothetical protein PFISCL1PPCAC_135, partial [Pristionchus fissidentatus]
STFSRITSTLSSSRCPSFLPPTNTQEMPSQPLADPLLFTMDERVSSAHKAQLHSGDCSSPLDCSWCVRRSSIAARLLAMCDDFDRLLEETCAEESSSSLPSSSSPVRSTLTKLADAAYSLFFS